MSDLIDRQALMESIGVADDCEKCQYNDTIHKGFCTMPSEFVNVCEAIADAPSAEPKWIPVTERLPEDLKPVNITYINEDPAPYYEHIKGIPFAATAIFYRGGWYWWSCICADILAEHGHSYQDGMHEGIEVTAWMPLPEPYQNEVSE